MNQFKLTEYPNPKLLNAIFKHQDIWVNDRKRYKAYATLCNGYGKKKKKTPQLTITYKRKQYGDNFYGRAFTHFENRTVKPMCSTTMWNKARSSLFGYSDYDIDIVNCHPVIIYHLIQSLFVKLNNGNDFDMDVVPAYREYVFNRDAVIQSIHIDPEAIERYNQTKQDNKTHKDFIKTLFVIISYGGSIDTWKKEFLLENDDFKNTEIVKQFSTDIQFIFNKLLKNDEIKKMYQEIYAHQKQLHIENPTTSKKPSLKRVFSIIIQEYEFRIISCAMDFIKANFKKEFNITCYCYDGIQISHKSRTKTPEIDNKVDTIIQELNTHITTKTGFNTVFIHKPFRDPLPPIDPNAIETNLPQLKPFLYNETFDLPNSSQLDCRYLSDKNEFLIGSILSHKITFIKSHLGTGKTTAMKALTEMCGSASILYFAPRRSFASEVHSNFQELGFVNYQNKKEFDGYNPRVVIQMESLHHVKKEKYDIVIVDESESCLKQFSSTETHRHNLKYNHITFARIAKHATHIVCLDAFLSQHTTDIMNKLLKSVNNTKLKQDHQLTLNNYKQYSSFKQRYPNFGYSTIIENIHQPYQRKAFQRTQEELEEQMITELKEGRRIGVFSSTEKFATHIYNRLLSVVAPDEIMLYTGKMDESKKVFDNIESVWSGVKVVIYTPIITIGVSYDPKDVAQRFDTLFMYGNSLSCCVRDVFQASLRIRHLKTNTLYFTLSTGHNRNAHLVAGFQNNLDNITRQQDFIKKYDFAFESANEWIKCNFAYNLNEDAISARYYDAVFYEYLKRCGYEINVPIDDYDVKEELESNIPPYTDIPLLSHDEYEELKKYGGNRTEIDTYSMAVYDIEDFAKINDDNWEDLYKKYKNGMITNMNAEINNNSKAIEEKEIDVLYDANAKMKFKKLDNMLELNTLFHSRNSWTTQFTSQDVDANLSQLVTFLEDNSTLYDLRRCNSKNGKKKWVVAGLKKVYENWTKCELNGKKSSKLIDGKITTIYKYSINLGKLKDCFYPIMGDNFTPTQKTAHKLPTGVCLLDIASDVKNEIVGVAEIEGVEVKSTYAVGASQSLTTECEAQKAYSQIGVFDEEFEKALAEVCDLEEEIVILLEQPGFTPIPNLYNPIPKIDISHLDIDRILT
tara:strand:- start:241 stop:3645 length:3405 start_codon:yes stop_codon:yes gene_type:complete